MKVLFNDSGNNFHPNFSGFCIYIPLTTFIQNVDSDMWHNYVKKLKSTSNLEERGREMCNQQLHPEVLIQSTYL